MGLEFLEGNEAIARGAMKANCNFFAGYPITPSSSILQYMLNMVPYSGGVAIQAEDEIASIGFCIGAAMAGSKVLTATSGPGISLYSENIGLAIMGETPMVIVNVQRQGPATGSATKGAEGDIQFTRWCTSGGLPVIVLSPATVGEAYELTYRAFNLSEQYRLPVFLLTNKEIGITRESVDLDTIALPSLVERARVVADEEYLPHYFDKLSEVPAISDFGGEHIARFTTSTHDKAAYLTTSPLVIQEMIDHYTAKIEEAADELALVKEDFQDGAEILIISYGITSRSTAVAVREARAKGVKISALTLQTLYPVSKTAMTSAMNGMKKVIVPEMNMGQYILEVERLVPAGVELVGVNKMDTTLISPDEILERGGLR
ncbi:MAG: pyruvate flavodoxin/ferredoxin oxidoreductase [Gammaproteobacteria bacterium]|nr:pyruvate flavodoxin/ferredoxin oxidoreductase [Gammaproteobacteria bacterium]MDH3467919.1 pyruvate flavodoxin/ferredoxin oxidoreductase [Gammaproteobacteria bacterium]